MKIIVFGTGAFYQNRKQFFKAVEIVAFIDNNTTVQNTVMDGVPVYSPADAVGLEYDYVCIMSNQYAVEMIKQLVQLKYDFDKIIGFGTFSDLVKDIICEGSMQIFYKNLPQKMEKYKGKVLLITHELSLSGAPMVLFYAALALKMKGYEPVVLSPQDGKLKEVILNQGIPVVIESAITGKNAYLYNWMSEFDFVLVCTFTYGKLIGELADFSKPILWWLHESEEVYSGWWAKAKPERIGANTHIYAGGQYALDTYRKYFKNDNCKMLLYGIPEENRNFKLGYQRNHEKIIFAVIAVLQSRKGQDIFVDAVKRLSEAEKEKAEFWIVGPDPGIYPEYVESLKQALEEEPHVRWLGEWSKEKLLQEYENIDVVVCPSRDDPMPVVLPEAMMFYKTCIVSKGAGTVSFINDKQNGLVCEPDADDLAKQMAWIIAHPDALEQMGKEGRKLYEDVFSLEAFGKTLTEIIEENCRE